MSVADRCYALKTFTELRGDLRQLRLTSDHSWLNAVNCNVQLVKIVLGVYQGGPFVSELSVGELGDANLAY